MIRYVQRDGSGAIIASYAAPQPGIATEALDSSQIPAIVDPLLQRLALGIAITSTSSAIPASTFALDPKTQSDLSGIAATVGLLGTFPDGTMAGYAYPDINGAPVAFPSITVFKNFYAAYVKLLQQLNQTAAILAQGGQASWPSQQVTIA